MITQEFLKQHYRYEDGQLIDLNTNRVIGWPNGSGRIQVYILKKLYYLHRMIWLYHYGDIKPLIDHIDHIDRNVSNNRIENLREATATQSSCNRVEYNASGFRGVDKFSKNKWRAKIRFNNKHIHIGYFDSPEEASAAYRAKASELHKEFAVFECV